MEEYPQNHTNRQLDIDFLQEPQLTFDEPVVLKSTDNPQRGFNYATYVEATEDV